MDVCNNGIMYMGTLKHGIKSTTIEQLMSEDTRETHNTLKWDDMMQEKSKEQEKLQR